VKVKVNYINILKVFLPLVIILYLFWKFRINDGQWKYVINSDGRGYYHYFLEYFIDESARDIEAERQYLIKPKDVYYNKYSCGSAILLSPFFAAGYVTAILFDFELSGYSLPFQFFMGIGAIFYLVQGSFFLYRLLLTYSIREPIAYITSIAVAFGTNVLFYTLIEATMSHVYSFFIINALLLCLRNYFKNGSEKSLFLSAFCFAILMLVRPFNGLILLFIPFLFLDLYDFSQALLRLKKSIKTIVYGVLLVVILGLIQLISWYDQSGEWMLYAYANEGFYFLNPQIFKVLFSFNRGLFIYTPVFLVAIAGLYFMYKKYKKGALYFIGFFFVLTYFISAWWCWNYATGFGLRPFIDYYGVFAIPLAFLLNEQKKIKFITYPLLVFFIFLNLVQSYQYKVNILHHFSMNYEKYKYIFLKTDDKYIDAIGGNFDVKPYSKSGLGFFKKVSLTDEEVLIKDEFAFTQEYDAGFFPEAETYMYWKVYLERLDVEFNNSENTFFVIDFSDETGLKYYYAFKINDIPNQPAKEWKEYFYPVYSQHPKANEKVKFYIWNRDKKEIKIRNFNLEFYISNDVLKK
jgi:hypothetical protein